MGVNPSVGARPYSCISLVPRTRNGFAFMLKYVMIVQSKYAAVEHYSSIHETDSVHKSNLFRG